MPTVRTSLLAGEPLKLKVIILGENPHGAVLFWRPLATGEFREIPLQHVARAVYAVQLPGEATQSDFEYFVRATAGGRTLQFPAAAPTINQTVVVADP